MATTGIQHREWRMQGNDGEYLISSSLTLLDHDFINTAFATEDMYWAKPLPLDQIATLLKQSLTLGLYKVLPAVPSARNSESPSSPRTPSPTVESQPEEKLKQIGMARFVTDHVTTAYLTDVYIDPQHRGKNLFRWLISRCREVMKAFPAMRRSFLLANPDVGRKFYSKELGFFDITDEAEHVVCMTRRAYDLNE